MEPGGHIQGVPPKCTHPSTTASSVLGMKCIWMNAAFTMILGAWLHFRGAGGGNAPYFCSFFCSYLRTCRCSPTAECAARCHGGRSWFHCKMVPVISFPFCGSCGVTLANESTQVSGARSRITHPHRYQGWEPCFCPGPFAHLHQSRDTRGYQRKHPPAPFGQTPNELTPRALLGRAGPMILRASYGPRAGRSPLLCQCIEVSTC